MNSQDTEYACDPPRLASATAAMAVAVDHPARETIFTNFRPSFSYLYLAYLGFLLLDPLLDRNGARLWPPTLLVLAVFIAVFQFYVHTTSNRVRLAVIAFSFVLGMATLPWNTGGATFFVYAAALLPFSIRSLRVILAAFAVEIAGAVADHYILHANWYGVGLSSFLLVVIGGSNIYFAEQKRANQALRLKQEEVEALAAVAERERIARDLHDVLGHTLSVIVLKSELAGRLLQQPDATDEQLARAATEIADVERTARTALSEVREAIGGYRARGLPAEIEAARRTLGAAGVALRCDAPPPAAGTLSATQETVLALALREAVTNIVRHACATECTLRFDSADGRHALHIEDNGTAAATPRAAEGNGLRGMRERVEALGGRLRLTQNHGMQLAIELPPAN